MTTTGGAAPHSTQSSHAAIQRLIASYAELVDDGDFAGLGTPLADAEVIGSGGPVQGRAAIEQMLRNTLLIYDDGTPGTHHVVSNMAIDVDEELGTATARSYVTVFQALSDLPLQPIAAGRYEDRFGRSDGQWAFVQRRILIRLTGHLGHHLRAVGRDAGDSMAEQTPAAVRVVRPGQASEGQQRLTYFAGVSAQTAGSTGLCPHRPVIPPGGRAHAHRHTGHESAIYLLDGEVRMFWGEDLRQQAVMSTGDFAYIPPGVPHLPVNLSSTGPATALVARTDPNEQESVVLLPDLDGLPHLWTVPDIGGLPSGPRSCR